MSEDAEDSPAWLRDESKLTDIERAMQQHPVRPRPEPQQIRTLGGIPIIKNPIVPDGEVWVVNDGTLQQILKLCMHDWVLHDPEDNLLQCSRCGLYRDREQPAAHSPTG